MVSLEVSPTSGPAPALSPGTPPLLNLLLASSPLGTHTSLRLQDLALSYSVGDVPSRFSLPDSLNGTHVAATLRSGGF